MLAEMIAKQKAEGGHLVLYRRIYTLFTITWTRDKVRHVPIGESRILHGIWHSTISLLFGIWGPRGIIMVLMFCALNLRGGIDVTAQFTNSPTDLLHGPPPDPGQAERDLIAAQWSFVGLGALVILIVILIFGLPTP